MCKERFDPGVVQIEVSAGEDETLRQRLGFPDGTEKERPVRLGEGMCEEGAILIRDLAKRGEWDRKKGGDGVVFRGTRADWQREIEMRLASWGQMISRE